jgi:hypothetical protein
MCLRERLTPIVAETKAEFPLESGAVFNGCSLFLGSAAGSLKLHPSNIKMRTKAC